MPNWKKVIVSGSDAVLNSVSGSSFVYSGGDVIAQTYLKSLNSTGDEGGELFLNKAVTNTTLTGGVTVDVYQNRLRFFEQGGSARGFYLDITTGGGGASTNLASGGGTVTSVSASGTVSGITLGGGPITGAGTLTLSGTISGLTNSNLSGTAGITNANLANSAITIAGNSISLGGSITAATILSGTGVFSGSAQIPNSSIANAQLANSSVTIGSTGISLGGTSTTLAGLTNVTSTNFTGSLFGTATQATQAQNIKINSDSATNAARPVVFTDAVGSSQPLYADDSALTYNPSTDTLSVSNLTGTSSWATNVVNNGVTSVGGTGTVNGITLTGTVTSTGNLTLGGTLSGIGNSQLTNSSVTIGSTGISLGGTSTTLAGLTNVNSTNFTGSLLGAATSVTNAVTFNNGGAGDASGTTYNGSAARTISYNTVGAPSTGGTGATGTWGIGISGNAATATTAQSASTALVTTNAVHYPIFVDANNLTPASEKLGTIAGYNFNPGTTRLEITGSLFATNITGSLRGTASYATMASQSGYTMQFVLATTGSNPAASTTYRLGAPVRTQLNTTSGRTRIYVPRPGKVGYAHLYIRTNGTLASAGTSTLSLGKNSSISETIATSTTAGSSADAVVSSTAISMSVAQGDFLEINWVTPAWATLPTGVEASGIIYIENNI